MFAGFKGRSIESLKEEFNVVLDGDIDYQKLFDIFSSEWETTTRPMPKDLRTFVTRARRREVTELQDSVKSDLLRVAKWFNSVEYQSYRRPIPFEIQVIINEHHFTADMINRMLVSEELLNA